MLCAAKWDAGVWERVTRSAVGASDTMRWVRKCALSEKGLCGGLIFLHHSTFFVCLFKFLLWVKGLLCVVLLLKIKLICLFVCSFSVFYG